MKISIIIPVLNEETYIESVVQRLLAGDNNSIAEIIVVDGGSSDSTVKLAEEAGATVLISPEKGRAQQMNYGVQHSTGDLLYFVHGDTLPPLSYVEDLQKAVAEGAQIGSFRLSLDSKHLLLQINSFMTRFKFMWCRGGDQTLFITRKAFEELGGYSIEYCIMEEYDLILRARKKYGFKVIPKCVLASARKYNLNGYFRVQFANFIVFNMFRFGISPKIMLRTYRRLLNWG
ncbi:MAG: TIGR04283 family arsenosugar biosynthesis glycosyltransferase [Saprospiraceae bacterium]|nr:TIGR04283 family arsenosugar biosynthesis glycosyltransferase [Saprospiraceae bacterium]